MLPNFLIIGAMKSGTSSLYQYVRSHPQVFMPGQKELQFFGTVDWRQHLVWYEEQFEGADGAVAVGEASTNYTKHPEIPDVPAQIAEVLPDVRLVYLVRHPIERARSQYLHAVLMGRESGPVEAALRETPRYLDFSRYAMQIERYLEHFPRERLLVALTEDLKRDRLATVRRVFDFLEVDPTWVPPNLDDDFYRTEERRERRPALLRVRRLPGYEAVVGAAPLRLRQRLWKLVEGVAASRVDPARAVISDQLRLELEERLREDVRRLRSYLGNGFDGWGIA